MLMLSRFFTVLMFLAIATAADASDRIGVVLMHGKAGDPSHLRSLAEDLVRAGYLVETPVMPWSASRHYDRSLSDAHAEIDHVVAALRAMGARKIVIGGHSMGANMAMGYVATHPERADALLALGPGQTVEGENFRIAVGASVAQARQLIAEGTGDQATTFSEIHLGKVSTVAATPRVYLSYFDPNGLANMSATAPTLRLPLLWTVGKADKNMMGRGRSYAFDRAQPNPFSRYVEVEGDHMATPEGSRDVVVRWLAEVFAR